MRHLRAARGATAECAEDAETHPAFRGGGSPAPATEGDTPSGLPARRQRYIVRATDLHMRSMGETPMPRGSRRTQECTNSLADRGIWEIWR